MPRIDPLQLLKCLSVLLTPEGGILSRDEVPRLVNLMTKFSKKLVSKCVYVLILKNTTIELVDMFMAEGGWTLIQTWLQDAVQTANWHLVKEILGLLLITPVDVERLKLNILPKLIKSLSRREDLQDVAGLSSQLVRQWLTIVKGTSALVQGQIQNEKVEVIKTESNTVTEIVKNISEGIDPSTFYKKDETDSSDKVETSEPVNGEDKDVEMKDVSVEKEKLNEDKSKSKSSSKSSSSRNKEKNRDRDRHRDKEKSKSSSGSNSSSSSRSNSSKSSSRDKDRKEKDRKDRDRNKSRDKSRDNGSIKSNSSSRSSKEKKESDSKKEKSDKSDKDTKNSLDAFKTPSLEKLGRIPKKSTSVEVASNEVNEVKKKAFSIGIRKDVSSEERPKTVKVFNSKLRSTGLEEEAKPAPSRVPQKKVSAPIPLPQLPLKRISPPRDVKDSTPPEKKIRIDKIDIPDRPGAIKLIPPKPKPMLQESDLFNNALTAATSKKEPKKRKRKPSISKETPTSPSTSPAHDAAVPTTPPATQPSTSPPLGLKNIAPINFYQDTLTEETEEKQEDQEIGASEPTEDLNESTVSTASENKENEITSPRAVTPTDDDPEEIKKLNIDGGIRGVLMYSKRKGPKKTISWKNDNDLVEIRYFELDETERVNVTKAFNDMAKMDISNEREALQQSRKVGGEDLMESQIRWRIPFEIDLPEALVIPGSRSLEKDIQFAREKSVLQALYFDKRKIPDSPEEPIPENHQMSDPVIIALEDPESQEIDLRTTPWPEPKGNAPLPEPQIPIIFPNIPNMQVPFNPQFNNMPPVNFQNMPPRFPVPGGPMVPQIPNNFVPPNLMPNDMMVPPNMMPPNELLMNQMNPNMFQGGGPMSDGYGPGPGPGPEPDFSMFGNPNGPPNNMFPPNNFRDNRPHHRGGGFRRGGRGGKDNGSWVRMKDSRGGGGGNWRRGGGGNRGGRLCKNIQNHGYCRNGDNCPFIHP